MPVLRRSLRGLVRNPGLHALTLATVTLIFLVVATLGLIYANLDEIITNWQAQFRMSVALSTTPSTARVGALRAELLRLPGVAGAEFVDSEAALDALAGHLGQSAEANPSQAKLVELLGANPLPATFRLRVSPEAQEPTALKTLAGRAGSLPGVAAVRYGDAWAGRFYSFFRLFKLVAAATCGLLFLTAAFIISAQMRLALSLRRDEIALLRLLGAGGVFIKTPYVIEGALLGSGGAAVASLVSFALYRLFAAQAGTDLESLLSATHFLPPAVIGGLVGFGAVLGILGSLISLRGLSA
jgi:cell division transport system permease protein